MIGWWNSVLQDSTIFHSSNIAFLKPKNSEFLWSLFYCMFNQALAWKLNSSIHENMSLKTDHSSQFECCTSILYSLKNCPTKWMVLFSDKNTVSEGFKRHVCFMKSYWNTFDAVNRVISYLLCHTPGFTALNITLTKDHIWSDVFISAFHRM